MLKNKLQVLLDPKDFFSYDLTRTLTHLTADINVFTSLPHSKSDYEKWKSVFNIIQGLKEVRYFVCVREKAGVFGKFSSSHSLNRALAAIVTTRPHVSKAKMESKWFYDTLIRNVQGPQLKSHSSSSITTCHTVGVNSNWPRCFKFWKIICCFKTK